jgi:hypothetical protein
MIDIETVCDMPMFTKHLSNENMRASQQLYDFIDFCSPNEVARKRLFDCLIVLMVRLIDEKKRAE